MVHARPSDPAFSQVYWQIAVMCINTCNSYMYQQTLMNRPYCILLCCSCIFPDELEGTDSPGSLSDSPMMGNDEEELLQPRLESRQSTHRDLLFHLPRNPAVWFKYKIYVMD